MRCGECNCPAVEVEDEGPANFSPQWSFTKPIPRARFPPTISPQVKHDDVKHLIGLTQKLQASISNPNKPHSLSPLTSYAFPTPKSWTKSSQPPRNQVRTVRKVAHPQRQVPKQVGVLNRQLLLQTMTGIQFQTGVNIPKA